MHPREALCPAPGVDLPGGKSKVEYPRHIRVDVPAVCGEQGQRVELPLGKSEQGFYIGKPKSLAALAVNRGDAAGSAEKIIHPPCSSCSLIL